MTLRQHPIDLLPESVRARGQARVRAGRYVTAAAVSIVLVILATTHSRLELEHAREALVAAREQADLVLNAEAKAAELGDMIRQVRRHIDQYECIALPLDPSAVLATVINRMPEGMTLDRIDLDAGARRAARTPRSRGAVNDDQTPPRVLIAEISGFAPNDRHIAEFVGRLDETPPLRAVSLDFSRTRVLRGHSAREFRLSFRIDLDATYERVDAPPPSQQVAMEEANHE